MLLHYLGGAALSAGDLLLYPLDRTARGGECSRLTLRGETLRVSKNTINSHCIVKIIPTQQGETCLTRTTSYTA